MRRIMSRGLLLCVEGLDRSGKTTLCNRIVSSLNADSDELVRGKCYFKFPERLSAVGSLIDGYLQKTLDMSDQAIHLLFSANRWENKQTILDRLDNGHCVVLDRYAYSGVAYSVLKGHDYEWCRMPDRGLPRPDCVIFLYAGSDALLKRDGFGAERYERADVQSQARQIFLDRLREPDWFVLDTSELNPDEVFERVDSMLSARYGKARPIRINEPVQKLWVEEESRRPRTASNEFETETKMI